MPQPIKAEADRQFSNLKNFLQTLLSTPEKVWVTRFLAIGEPVRIENTLELLEKKLYRALMLYERMRIDITQFTLFFALRFSFLCAPGLDFTLATKEDFWRCSLPLCKLGGLPEWGDYISHLYNPILSVESWQKCLALSKKIRSGLNEQERVRVVLLEWSIGMGKGAAAADIADAMAQGKNAKKLRLTSPTQRYTVPSGQDVESAADEDLRQLTAQVTREYRSFTQAPVRLAPQERYADIDLGDHLERTILAILNEDGGVNRLFASRLESFTQIQEVDCLYSESLLTGAQKLLKVLSRVRRSLIGGTLESKGLTLSRRGKCSVSQYLCTKTKPLSDALNRISAQIREEKERSLTLPPLRTLMQRATMVFHNEGAQPHPNEELLVRSLFLLQLTGFSLQVVQSPQADPCPAAHLPNIHSLLMHVRSLLCTFVRGKPMAEDLPSSPQKIQDKRKPKRKKKTRKNPKTKKSTTRSSLSPTTPQSSPPSACEEAVKLTNLSRMPLRISRHPRTYNRPEFADDRREQALHYLPPQLVQLLLCEEDPFIVQYVRWAKNDPSFDGNHSVHATVLCHDRETNQVHIGKLTIGVTPEGLVYHVYLNPYANPLLGGQTAELGLVQCPPIDVQDAVEGFAPVGECQISWNEGLQAIDALNLETNCLYRIFLQESHE